MQVKLVQFFLQLIRLLERVKMENHLRDQWWKHDWMMMMNLVMENLRGSSLIHFQIL